MAGGRAVIRFDAAPEPLTRVQRNIVIATSIVLALTRVWSLSRSMWEWDEALFAHAVRDFDVPQHHPHPPGYPLFIAAAKLLRVVIHSDFRAVQAVTLIGAIALFPLALMLARELRFSFATAYGGALIFVFAPNVWYYGSTAFSDVPGLALILGACALLLRGCRDGRSYLLGALILGLACGLRPQGILAGAAPALVATWFQFRVSWRRVVAAAAIGGSMIVVCYGGAALASSSPSEYIGSVQGQQKYVHDVDSYHNPRRPPLVPTLLRPFFFDSLRAGRDAARIIAVLCAIALLASLIRPHPGIWLLVLIFLPLNVFSWLMLDINAASRYAVSYAAMYALLAAYGIELIARFRALATILTLALAAHIAYRALPAVRDARRSSAPNAAAMEWILRNLDPKKTRIYVIDGLGPFAAYYLEPKYDVVYVPTPDDVPQTTPGRDAWFVTDAIATNGAAHNFVRPRGKLWEVARPRYFEASVLRYVGTARFDDGWYDQETNGKTIWRWMSARGAIAFPPLRGNARLTLEFSMPIDSLPTPPTLDVTLNGTLVERIVCTEGHYSKNWIVLARGDAPNVVTLATTATANPKKLGIADDGRDLGLLLYSYSWGPAK